SMYSGDETAISSTQVATFDTTRVLVYDTALHVGGVNGGEVVKREAPLAVHSLSIDTSAIVEAYLEKRTYKTVFQDTNLNLSLSPVISENQLDTIAISYKLLRPSERVTITKTIQPPRYSLFTGGSFISAPGQFALIPTISLRCKDQSIYTLGYWPGEKGGSFQISASIKIFDFK
ncbi:hypothetical protein, partial [Phaeocystidibacter marisrubri]|uniref:hypothetical protein n=1 Tax=Phaeocystidibacter marisrubri TaxID=1577780 RepID=UPI00147971A9